MVHLIAEAIVVNAKTAILYRPTCPSSGVFVEIHDQVAIAGRVTKVCEHGGRFGSMLRAVIDEVRHRFP